MQRRDHVRIRKSRPSSSAVILMLLLGSDEKPNPKRPRRNISAKNHSATSKAVSPPTRAN